MATALPAQQHASTSPNRSPRRSRRIFKIFGFALALLLLVAAGGAAYIYFAARRTLPQLDGSISVPGLSAPVIVIRDAQGVPHIRARSEPDLFFAQGFVTAQDRLWQLDMARRFAAGELSELLGPAYVALDRMQRVLQIRTVAERGAGQLPPRERAHFEAYARGVNAYMEQQRDRLPIEFRVLQ